MLTTSWRWWSPVISTLPRDVRLFQSIVPVLQSAQVGHTPFEIVPVSPAQQTATPTRQVSLNAHVSMDTTELQWTHAMITAQVSHLGTCCFVTLYEPMICFVFSSLASPSSPRTLMLQNVTNTSVVISWLKPVHLGGRDANELFYVIIVTGIIITVWFLCSILLGNFIIQELYYTPF